MEWIFVSFVFGFKIDFLDCLEEMELEFCSYWIFEEWVVIFF